MHTRCWKNTHKMAARYSELDLPVDDAIPKARADSRDIEPPEESTTDAPDTRYQTTKWEIWAYYACVALLFFHEMDKWVPQLLQLQHFDTVADNNPTVTTWGIMD